MFECFFFAIEGFGCSHEPSFCLRASVSAAVTEFGATSIVDRVWHHLLDFFGEAFL
jgi:hypothetical protein